MAHGENQINPEDLPKGTPSQLSTLWAFMLPYKMRMALALFFLLLASSTTLAMPFAFKNIVDMGFGGDNLDAVQTYFYFLGGLAVIMAFATAFRFYFVTWIGERVVADIRSAVYTRLVSMSPEYFEENRPGEIVSRLTADTTLIQSVVGSSLSIWLRNGVVAIAGTTMLTIMSPRLMLSILIIVPIVLFIIVKLGRRLRSLGRSSQDSVADVGARANETLSALNVVQAFTREDREVTRFSDQVEEAFGLAKKRIAMRSLLTALVIMMIFGGITYMLYNGAVDVIEGTMTGGEIVEFIMLSMFVGTAFGALSEMYGDLMRAAGASGRLSELLNVIPKISAPAKPIATGDRVEGNIAFTDVLFSYPTRPDVAALNDFNFQVKAGETVALVGPSGAGKTTVLQMLLRFYDPQKGIISIDGIDIKATKPEDFRRHIAFVPQDAVIFADTVMENIRYGRLEASDDEVREASRAAAALNFIEAMPEGFDTYLGERGTRLSGGQRQRISIARALLRDAPILLLDEATSALDAESEMQVQTALENLMEGRSTIVIAHRLATVKSVDRIIVMEDGKIVDTGTHVELTARSGLYKRLADLQFGEG